MNVIVSCSVCGQLLGPDSMYRCSECGKIVCRDHITFDPVTSRKKCTNCVIRARSVKELKENPLLEIARIQF